MPTTAELAKRGSQQRVTRDEGKEQGNGGKNWSEQRRAWRSDRGKVDDRPGEEHGDGVGA